MFDFLGLLYDGHGMLLEGDGPRTFTALQDVTMVFRAIVQAGLGDLDGELRLCDRLWVIPPHLDPDSIGGRLVGLDELVHAGRRIGLASESADAGRLVLPRGARAGVKVPCLSWPQRSGETRRFVEHAVSQGDEALGSTTVSGGVGVLSQRQQAIT